LAQEPNSASPPTLVQKLTPVDDDSGPQRFVPTLMTSIRLKEAFYASIGTTPDKNIFKTVLLGLSYYKPDWRTLFTVGGARAKGASQKDVEEIAKRYSVDGIAIDKVNPAQIPSGSKEHWRFFVCLTFAPF
jgi:hypothetical protein